MLFSTLTSAVLLVINCPSLSVIVIWASWFLVICPVCAVCTSMTSLQKLVNVCVQSYALLPLVILAFNVKSKVQLFLVRLKVDQRAGLLSLQHLGIFACFSSICSTFS